ncbi:hypothetical protein EDD18DRAFT_1112521 [Armillaria luteobubalina]|uniref:Uncharacterized protein n=1 Tax=Armillaria luteobubalina TaxID=153913 RepID=A0AA39PFM7_9AGAR|nr:hypothetical protein EDD18DRAFT_1112521 [Armillaria luteobubalina]
MAFKQFFKPTLSTVIPCLQACTWLRLYLANAADLAVASSKPLGTALVNFRCSISGSPLNDSTSRNSLLTRFLLRRVQREVKGAPPELSLSVTRGEMWLDV